jgi:hypothetical protein
MAGQVVTYTVGDGVVVGFEIEPVEGLSRLGRRGGRAGAQRGRAGGGRGAGGVGAGAGAEPGWGGGQVRGEG